MGVYDKGVRDSEPLKLPGTMETSVVTRRFADGRSKQETTYFKGWKVLRFILRSMISFDDIFFWKEKPGLGIEHTMERWVN